MNENNTDQVKKDEVISDEELEAAAMNAVGRTHVCTIDCNVIEPGPSSRVLS